MVGSARGTERLMVNDQWLMLILNVKRLNIKRTGSGIDRMLAAEG